MPSPTDLCNDALAQIGATFITSIDDNSRPATVCKRFYAQTRDQVLRQHNWTFALKRSLLSRDLTAPLFQWSFSFSLPADNIRPVHIGTSADAVPWKVEGLKILTDEVSVSLLYVARIEDPNVWDDAFFDAFSTRLASKLALSITHDSKFSADLLEQYKTLVLDASAIDQQQGTPDILQTPDLIDIRIVPFNFRPRLLTS